MAIERLSPSDAAMLIPDDLGWPQDIAALAVVDGDRLLDSDGHLSGHRVRDAIRHRLHRVPRLRQVVVRPSWGAGMPFWADATAFDIADHVRVMPLAAGAGDPELLTAFEMLRAARFDPTRPLWQVWLLPGLAGRRVGVVIKLHHALADGVTGIATIAALLDASADPSGPEPPPWTPRPMPSRTALFVDNVRRRLRELARPVLALFHPSRIVRGWRRLRPLLREVLVEPSAPRTSLARVVGPHRHYVVERAPLARWKAIAHAHGVTINDVLLTVTAGGLRALLASRGDRVDDLVLRVSVPISVHAERRDASGNRDSGMLVPLPVGEADDGRRLRTIAAETVVRKRQPRAQFGGAAFPGAMLLLRTFMRRLRNQRMINLYVTNVPGPPMPLYLAGARILEIAPIVPLTGNVPLAVGALSYAGELAVTSVADRDAVPDLEVFASGLRASFAALGGQLAATASSDSTGSTLCATTTHSFAGPRSTLA
jgi:diacylglycerol O-acyltransferase / wax synthase